MQVLPHKPLSYEYQPKYPHYLTHRHARAHTHVSVATGCEVYLVQGQHVEVTDVVLLSVSDPRPALLLIDHLSHILAHKLTLRGKSIFSSGSTSRWLPPTVTKCCVFTFLMSWTQRRPHPRESVLKISTWLYWRLVNAWLRQWSPAGQTCRLGRLETVSGASECSGRSVMEGFPYLGVAFIQQHAVDALRLHSTGALICCLAVTARDLWQVGREDLNLSYRSIHLQRLHT